MHPRTGRRPAALAVVALLTALVLAACGRSTVSGVGAQMTSPPRESATTEDGGGGDEGALPAEPDPGDIVPDELVPDLSVPGLEEADDCLAVLETYAGLAASAIGGPEAAAEARAAAEDLKASLPEDLHDDLDVIADAYAGIAEDGFLDGLGAFDDPEFAEANENINAYLQETCGGA